MLKKNMQLIAMILSLGFFAPALALTPIKGNIYHQEFKQLRSKRFHGAILDRKAAVGPRFVLQFTENIEQVGFWGMLFRHTLAGQNPVAISSSSMPQLHAYVSDVCSQLGIRVPTIFVTKNKTTFFGNPTSYSASTKLLMSSGAICIGQDLLLDVSQKAVEAAIAHVLCEIKHNHQNKEILLTWIVPKIISRSLPIETRMDDIRNQIICLLLVRALIAKTFERQADAFVYADMNNADGFIELCSYWDRAEKKVDTDYDDAWAYLKQSRIGIFNSLNGNIIYFLSRTGHRFDKLQRWIRRNTFIGANQGYQARIDNAKNYVSA